MLCLWGEINKWYLYDPRVCFIEGSEFDSGTALREGIPTQKSHVISGASQSGGVVSGHKPSSSFLIFLDLQSVWIGGVPAPKDPYSRIGLIRTL